MRLGLNSSSMKRRAVKVPSGNLSFHFSKAKPKSRSCASCGAQLKGIPRLTPIRFSNTAKSTHSVSRKFGGELCSNCSRELIKKNFRVIAND